MRRSYGLVLALLVLSSAHAAVTISEFVADNDGGLLTAAGEASDWIELHNSGPDPVDLGGWFLSDNASDLTKWRIPDGTSLASNGYLVVFADSSPVAVTNGELHASFSLSKDGEFLGLIGPDGTTLHDAYQPAYPPQIKGASYGRAPRVCAPVDATTPVRYRVPNAAGNAPWQEANGALGFSSHVGAYTVRFYRMTSAIANIDVAESMVANPSAWATDRTYPVTGAYEIIDFYESSDSGAFTHNLPFPGLNVGENINYFVVTAETTLYVPQAGMWTFCVGSDDGFRLRIDGHGVSFSTEFAAGRGFGNTLGVFNFPVAGTYALTLSYFENTGGAALEFSAAQGSHGTFDATVFKLVGDPAGGLLHAGAIGAFADTDVSDTMLGINARLDAEWQFVLDTIPAPGDTLLLAVRVADGFSASLNGTPVVSLNMPATLFWNSTATAARPIATAIEPLAFVLPPDLFTAGTNVLTVTALNQAASDGDFLIQPVLTWRTAAELPFYFKTPTPGAANSRGYTVPTPLVVVSEPRGYKTAPFTATLICPERPDAEIRYTLDGSTPAADSPLYTAPLSVTATTTLRAAVVDPESVRQRVTTVTWLFLEDVLRQGTTPPPGWPADRAVNNHKMEYGMRQEIVDGDPVRLRAGMTNAIPSISLVTDLAHLFGPQTGIYAYPGNDGIGWERPVSVELIDPVRGAAAEFHIDAGLRIRGAFSRSVDNPKHSLRLFFRSVYGESKLRFPLFDSEGASVFDKVDLRTSQNYSWAFQNSDRDTFVRETFSRDAQREMGMPYTRSRYYHLYINGQYWGLYQTQERGEADFAATYMGGDSDDWDCIKTSSPGYTTTASDGTFDAFNAFHEIAVNQGFSGAYANNYMRVKGLNPDGSRNPAYPVYLDEDNLICYMLCSYYTGDPDAPIGCSGTKPNNMYALYNRVQPDGFKWLRHDAEHSLGANGGVTADTTHLGANLLSQDLFNPATLHHQLCAHPAYRLRFADLVQRHLYGDGIFTPERAQALFQSRMDEIDLAIIGESARWGRGRTRDATWLPACNSVLNTYLTQRRDIVAAQFRARGWLPALAAPRFSTNSAAVPPGYQLLVSTTNTFYYTTDGTDPRLPDGSIHPAAIVVDVAQTPTPPQSLVARGAVWRYYDLGVEPATQGALTWRDRTYNAAAWAQGPALLGFAGSATANSVATVTRRYVNGVSGTQVTTTYFRHTFSLASTENIAALKLELLRDDGAIISLNGTEILRDNMPAGAVSYATWASAVVGSPAQNTYFEKTLDVAHLLRTGENVLAVELHQCNATSSDLYFDLALSTVSPAALADSHCATVTVDRAVTVLARAYNGNEWSALAEVALSVARPADYYAPLHVSELMYAPYAPEAGSPYKNDDFAWLELRNAGAVPLALEGVQFVSGISHTFGVVALGPGARLVLAKNPVAFAERHGDGMAVEAWQSGNLARKGETLALVDPHGSNILTFTYSNVWYPETYNTGRSLVVVDAAAPEPLWSSADNWRPSRVASGTPGLPDAAIFTAVRMDEEGTLQLDASGLEGTVELWFSDDLVIWQPCAPEAWSLNGGRLDVDLRHPSLPAGPRGFFQIRLRD